MKFSLSRFLVFPFSRCLMLSVAAILLIPYAAAQVVEIPDPNLESTVREALKLPDEIPLNQLEMLRLKRVDAADKGITDLRGLEHATFLEVLNLQNNLVEDITPLANLTHLIRLLLDYNQIHDINPLANLTNLTHLGLSENQIADISSLMNLTNLGSIGLSGNQINDISPLSGLVHLESLGLNGNPISNLSPLANLTNLKTLYLSGGRLISDITPLANLTQLIRLRLSRQSISDITPIANLTQLIHLRLDGNQVSDISPLANLTLLEELQLNSNAITDITPLIGLKNLKELWLADNPIGDFSPLLELQDVELDIAVDTSEPDLLNAVNIPDPNLRAAIRETLQLPTEQPITKQEMLLLTRLPGKFAWNRGITDLTGLQHATFLKHLALRGNQISDLEPIVNLVHLEVLTLDRNPITDLSPLANLVNLRILTLTSCIHITDISPLQHLVNLDKLNIQQTPVTDYSPIQGLNLVEFQYDQLCNMLPIYPPVRQRIETRTFPSINLLFGAVVNRQDLSYEEQLSLHDLMTARRVNDTLRWDVTPTEPTYALSLQLAGDIDADINNSQKQLELNPNMIFIRGLEWFSTATLDAFPPDSDFWLRDSDNNILWSSGRSAAPQIDFANPQVQDLLVKRIIAIDKCGLNDGVFLDGFNHHASGFVGRGLHPITDKEIIEIWRGIFTQVREQVRDDFLILINANRSKLPYYAEFVNGTFMETGEDYPLGYTYNGLKEIESTLLWAEQNLREPRINSLECAGAIIEPPDTPNNLRWMRVLTTISLTHSDGYVSYSIDEYDRLWYSFWEANLGQPVGPKAQRYKDIPGLFIREFTNGWAVYNRSGAAQTISLPVSATPVSDRGNNAASHIHLLPDLDGEIYLKAKNPADVNGDGRINVLDLVHVANNFGKADPDLNGDGVVNILDLTLVAQRFNQ